MKRFVIGFIFSAALMASLVACGGNRQGGAVAGTVVTGRQDPFQKYSPAISLTTVRTMTSTTQFDANDPEKRSFDENRWYRVFNEDMGISLTNKWIAADTDAELTRWNTTIASKDIPDFARVSDAVYKLLIEADYVADMGQILASYGSDEFLGMLTESDYQQMTQDGKLLGFPASAKAISGSSLLFYRQDWLDKVNLPPPETIEDVIKIAKAFKAAGLGGNETIGLLASNNITGGANFAAGDGKIDGFFNGYGAYINYWLEKDGKLVYSNVQPEMRAPILKMQELYKDGTINRDFAVTNNAVAQEYVAGGKVGIFYSTAWNVTQGMNTLHNNDPLSKIINMFPPPAVKAQTIPIQTQSPRCQRIFVYNKCNNPEAVVRMANLAHKYKFQNWQYYMNDNGFPWYKYLPWYDFFAPSNDDLLKSNAMREAELSGSTAPLPDPSWQGSYDGYLNAKAGKAAFWNLMLYGPGGSFSTLYDSYPDKILIDAYNGLPTETQSLKGTTINDELNTALFEVIMGADISVWDRAVERWFANGGNKITDEVNAWYRSVKK